MTIKVLNAGKVARRLKHIPGALELSLRETLFKAAQEVKDEAVREIEKPKHGRVYTRRRRNKGVITWRASAPGEAPAKKTGERMAKIKAKKANRKLKPQSRVVAPGIYRLLAAGLGKIAPRPLFAPVMRAKGPSVLADVKAATQRTVRTEAKR